MTSGGSRRDIGDRLLQLLEGDLELVALGLVGVDASLESGDRLLLRPKPSSIIDRAFGQILVLRTEGNRLVS